jgi:hypothetical protein
MPRVAPVWVAHASSVLASASRDRQLFCGLAASTENNSKEKTVSARRRNQHARRVRTRTPTKRHPARKTPPSGRPGQVKALDGVPPQPQNRQRLACVVQVLNFACNDAPLNTQRHANRVGQLRCIVILVGIVLILFVGICSRCDHG